MFPSLLYRLSPGVAVRVWFDNVGFTSPNGVPATFLGIVNCSAVFRITATNQVVFIPSRQLQAISL